MQFDELVLKIPDDEIHVRFHPRMTVLSGLPARERQALADTIIGALTGGPEETALRCVDGAGRTVIVLNDAGRVSARHDDGSGAAPVGELGSSPDRLRDLIIVQAEEITVVARAASADEPRELREARTSLAEITSQLEKAVEESRRAEDLQARLDEVVEQLRTAEDGAARRAYAGVLAEIEQLHNEADAGDSTADAVERDRSLVTGAEALRPFAEAWALAAERLTTALETFGDRPRLDPTQLARAASIADNLPTDVASLANALVAAETNRTALEQRLHDLTSGELPTPSDAVVEELGLLDQDILWPTAGRLLAAREAEHHVQITLGGLGAVTDGDGPTVLDEMEEAHRDLDAAEQAAESVRVPGVAGTGFGLAVALAGAIGAPMFIILGMLIAAGTGTLTLVLPRRRVAHAAAVERAALDVTGATSYLGFHLRRVDATMDPQLRLTAGKAAASHAAATAEWHKLAGPSLAVDRAKDLEHEIRAYHEALQRLGTTAAEVEQTRAELAERALPEVSRAQSGLVAACATVGLSPQEIDDPVSVVAQVNSAIELGRTARRQVEADQAQASERAAADELDERLTALRIDAGDLADRMQRLDLSVLEATNREAARAASRAPADIEADLARLQERADRLRRPDWANVTAQEAAGPSIEELEDSRAELQCELAEARPSVDAKRLADRHAALERRVASLAGRHADNDPSGDPGLVTDIQQHLLARLARSAKAGPYGDAVPALLDEVLERVPVDRKWDVLDHLYRLSEHHQLVYLSDDPFVAAWARQLASGSVGLLEPEPEPV